MTKKQSFNYQEALNQIEGIIDEIENGDPNVDELTEMVDQAFKLITQCKTKLKSTEEKLNDTLEQSEAETEN